MPVHYLPIVYPTIPNGNKNVGMPEIYASLFNNEQCDFILDQIKEDCWREKILPIPGPDKKKMSHKKICHQNYSVDPKDIFPLANMERVLTEANDKFWRYDLTGIDMALDPLMIIENSEKNEPCDLWYNELRPEKSQRKLAFIIYLSDPSEYEGGDFEAYNPRLESPSQPEDEISKKARGSIVIFPTFLFYRILRVTKGSQFTLSGWVHGPVFR